MRPTFIKRIRIAISAAIAAALICGCAATGAPAPSDLSAPGTILPDRIGIRTDSNPYGWLPEEDYKAFMERAERIAAYYDAIKSFPYAACDGERVWGEAAADIGGMAIGLKIAEKYKQFDEFLETYGVREGDLMYLAPEDRIDLWTGSDAN